MDPREFWANVLYLARLINGGLGVENLETFPPLPPASFECPNSSMAIVFSLYSGQLTWQNPEPLLKMPFDAKVSCVSVLGASPDFLADLKCGSESMTQLRPVDVVQYGVTNFFVDSLQQRNAPAGSTLFLDVASGDSKGLVLDLVAEHVA